VTWILSRRSWRFAVALVALAIECLGAWVLAILTYDFRYGLLGPPPPQVAVNATVMESYVLTALAVANSLLVVAGLVRPRRAWQIAFVLVQAVDVSVLIFHATRVSGFGHNDLGDTLVILSWALVPLLAALVVISSWRSPAGPKTP
jgi:hypothetical protein